MFRLLCTTRQKKPDYYKAVDYSHNFLPTGLHLGIKPSSKGRHENTGEGLLGAVFGVIGGINPDVDAQRRIHSLHEMPPVFGHVQNITGFERHSQRLDVGEARKPATGGGGKRLI